jgi:hypothetical protein
MVTAGVDYEEFADTLQKSLDMFGIKDAFDAFGTSRKEWIFKMSHNVGNKSEWNILKDGRIIMPNLGIN